MKKIALAAIAAVMASGTAHAAGNTDTDQGAATATVVEPITLTHDADAELSFGTFTVGTGGSVVVLAADGSGSDNGDVNFVAGSVTSADSFSVTGDAGRTFDIAVRNSTVSNGTDTMVVRPAASAATGTLDVDGNATFTVGGRLIVAGTESAGDYTGSYDATVTYQ